MTVQANTYAIPAAVATKLSGLGLSQDDLKSAAESALQYALDADTDNDTNGAVGSTMYLKFHRSLRDLLVPRGWTVDRTNNYETTVHPSGSHAIGIASGNPDTGNPDAEPSTKRDHGNATRGVVDRNYTLYMFAEDEAPREMRPMTAPRLSTWVILHFFDRDAEELRLELSLPLGMSSDGYMTAWLERILLPSIPFSSSTPPFDGLFADADDADQSAYTAEVERKAT